MRNLDPKVAIALARHRFAGFPLDWCDRSWLSDLVPRATRAEAVIPASRAARALLNRGLLERYAPASAAMGDMWVDPGAALALLPLDWHDALLLALGLRCTGLDLESAAGASELVPLAWKALAGVSSPQVPMQVGIAVGPALRMAIRARGESALLDRLASAPPALAALWRLRLSKPVVQAHRMAHGKALFGELNAWHHRLQSPECWGGVPCW
jgi:hypothetical protein